MTHRADRRSAPAARTAGHQQQWRKSSYSGGGNNCVEVAAGPAEVAVRDSKNPSGGELVFGPDAWTAFTAAIKRGAYDSL
jgi:hypothetical protein